MENKNVETIDIKKLSLYSIGIKLNNDLKKGFILWVSKENKYENKKPLEIEAEKKETSKKIMKMTDNINSLLKSKKTNKIYC